MRDVYFVMLSMLAALLIGAMGATMLAVQPEPHTSFHIPAPSERTQ